MEVIKLPVRVKTSQKSQRVDCGVQPLSGRVTYRESVTLVPLRGYSVTKLTLRAKFVKAMRTGEIM
jgi:hypothetical protein